MAPSPLKIYKYPLSMVDNQTITLPNKAEVLKIALSRTVEPDLWLWAKVNPNNDLTLDLEVTIIGTGNPIPEEPGEYFDTVFYPMSTIDLVFHVFLKGPTDA